MNTGNRFIFSVIAWSIVSVGFSITAMALPYQPGENVRIITRDISSGAASDLVEWQVVTEKTAPGSVSLSFFMTGSAQMICRLDVGASGSGLVWKDASRQPPQVIQQPDMIITPGTPVPCDMLPPNMVTGKIDSRSYEIKRHVGKQTFVDHFQVISTIVDIADAQSSGWLADFDVSGKLVMVTVSNVRTGALVVRQLWEMGADWWIFEETPYRQSWQVR